ncbi:MAG: PASTA domain-containing protein, partial [Desulfosudaceae bacterium]
MKKILIYLMMAWWVFPGSLSAAKIAVFGPQTYVRTTGAPDQYAEVFDTTALEGILTIRNGEATGSHRITSAIITLNDQQIFSPKDFKQHDHLLEAPIPIQETNQLDIELRSKPGEYLTIEITPTVQPPVITSSPVVTGTEGTPYLYDVEAMDPDDDVLQYSLVKCPGGMTINNTSGLMEWLPTREQVGEHEITIEVADTDGLSATQTYIVSVISANHAPILTPVENCMMDEDSTLEVGVSATDEDGDELAFTVTGLPSFGAFTDNGDGTGAISFAPGPDTIGRYAICVVVSDRIESVSDFFILTVDQTGLLGTYYNHSQGHPDMQVWNGGRNMVESMLTDNAPTLNVSGQSSYNQFDWWDEEYQVFQRLDSKTDLQNAFGAGRRWFPVNTGLSGDPYHFAVHWQGRFYVDEDKTYTYKMGSDDDAWVYIDNQLTLDLGGIHALSWTSDNVPLTKGFHDIDIFFAERHTSQSGFQLNFFSDLFSPPDPPVADFDFSQPILKDQPQSAAVLVDGSGSSNPDGDRLTCLWYGPFETQGGVAPVLRVPQGNYRVSLIVDNGVATSEVETLETTVHPCFYLSSISKPGEVSLDWNPVEGAEQYRIYRSTDADPLSFGVIGQTADTDFTDDNTDNDNTYLYVVGAVFQDGVGFSDIISRHPAGGDEANQRPVIYSSPVLNGTVGLSYTCDVNATDPDNDLISYQLTGNPDGMKIDPATGLISWIPPQAGSYEVTVQASDHNGGRDTQAFSIIVEPIKTTVPEVTGLTRAEASVEIAYAFSKVQSITEEYNDTVPAGVVIRQTPLAGSIIPLYAGVELVVSLGTRMTTIPDVAGMSRADAESAIIAAQLAVGDVTRDYSPDTPRGHVISQHPEAGICLPVDSTIDIVVSLGPEIVTVPDVSGLTLAEATAALNAETLSPGQITEVYISTPPAGIVFDQTPAAGTRVQHDTTVDVKISLGPW